MSVVQDAVQAVMKKAIALAPDGWIPGGHPDPMMHHKHGLIGASISRFDGPLKVSGKAQFCAEFPMERRSLAALGIARRLGAAGSPRSTPLRPERSRASSS